MIEGIAALGSRALGTLAWIGEVSRFGARAVVTAFRPPWEAREIAAQLVEVGWRSIPLVAASGLAVGAVMSMHTRATFVRFGAEGMIPDALAIAMIREIGPLFAAMLVAGRAGAAIGAELGSMRVTEQIDALEATAVDSFSYLAVTRIVACAVALPLLTVVMNFSGLVGGAVAESALTGTSLELFFRRAFAALTFTEYTAATLKTLVFGLIIGTVSTHVGYHTRGGSAGVGGAATRSVVVSSLLLILINVLLVKTIAVLFPGI